MRTVLPPSRDDLKLVTAAATASGDTIQLELLSSGDPPQAAVTASAVGFPITPEVVEVQSRGWSCVFRTVMPWLRPERRFERCPAPLPGGDPR